MQEDFITHIESAASAFKGHSKKPVRVISHLDADGICSSSILAAALTREGCSYTLSTVRQLTEDTLAELSKEDYSTYIFSDLGSGHLKMISDRLKGRNVLILDHHSADNLKSDGITLVNPHLFGIDGNKDISGSGVTYLFAKALNNENRKLAHLAVIGAIGDIQEKEGFSGLNALILEDAIIELKLKIEKGIVWFGLETKPLHKLLAYNTDIIIPGITGSEAMAVQFLSELDIDPNSLFNELSREQKQLLITRLIMKRAGEYSPESIIGNRYILQSESESSPFRDAREFSTMLNACGRMGSPSIGIGACLGDENSKQKALEIILLYKSKIINSLKWFEVEYEKKGPTIIEGDGYIIINAKDEIIPTIIGTIASIVSKSGRFHSGKKILALARDVDEKTKVSLRMSGEPRDTDLREIMEKIVLKSGGESGGHKNAAGAIIPTEREEVFIKVAIETLEKNPTA